MCQGCDKDREAYIELSLSLHGTNVKEQNRKKAELYSRVSGK
jgi:hypothetical protein